MADLEQVIRQVFASEGIDPNVAVNVARHEGLVPGVWQSNVRKNGVREPSYGPFQFLVGGADTGFPEGLGNRFMKETGLDPSDPKNAEATVRYAAKIAKTEGWKPWYGARAAHIAPWQGIKPGAATDTANAPISVTPPTDLTANMPTPIEKSDMQPVSPLGGMLAGFMQGFGTPVGGPTVTQDNDPQTAMAAAGLAERGRQLKSAFLPNVDAILGMSKRPMSG